jgi:WD40 repeat protein/serine/threonine protein kinase
MADEKIAIRILPTPATQNLAEEYVLKLARLTKLDPEKIRDRFAKGKGITMVTAPHPKVSGLVELVRKIGFYVTTGPLPEKGKRAEPARKVKKASARPDKETSVEETEWQIGDVIENLYEVRDIKHGGMGAVYIARHMLWNTMLAVKSLHSRLRKNEEDRALFVKEAETWIDIGLHPNIAACYYVRNIQDSPRIFIEYVSAGALNEWFVRRRGIGWDLILDLMIQFCDGLEHAHSKGLVHRDIKPGNCMMTPKGILKITDFGLTKRRGRTTGENSPLDQQDPDGLAPDRESVTAAGMGTPGYMAPEMWFADAEVGPQVDIYAFGVMLFEICCGRKPFVARGPDRRKIVAMAHLKKPPPRPSSLRKDIPESIERIILKCLAKDPGDRFPSARNLREEMVTAYETVYQRTFPRQPPDEVKLRADAWNNRALSLIDLNHLDEAKAALGQALTSDPNHPEAVFNKGLLEWVISGNTDWDLVVQMEEVIKTEEYRARGAHLLGRCLLHLGDASKALNACELSLSGEEAGEEWLKPYAIALIGCGRDDDAIEYMDKYLAEFPNDSEAVGWLIGALVRTGKSDKAESCLKALPRGTDLASNNLKEIADSYVFSGLEEQMVFEGHRAWVTCFNHLPKTGNVITGARDRTVKIWDSRSGENLKTFSIVGAPPGSVQISPDERIAAITGSQKGSPVRILDLESGRILGNLMTQEGLVTAMIFSPDGKHVLIVEERGVVRLWEIEKFKPEAKYKRIPTHTAAAAVFDESSNPVVFVVGMDRIVKRVDPIESEVVPFDKGHTEAVLSLRVSPDGKRVVSSGRDKAAIIWDAREGKSITEFKVHQDQVSAIALNPKRNLAASYDQKTGIRVWDTVAGSVVRTFPAGDSETLCLGFAPDGDRLLAGGKDMALRVWDVRGRPVVAGLALARVRTVRRQMKSDKKFKRTMDAVRKSMRERAYGRAYKLIRQAQSFPGYERSDLALDAIQGMQHHGRRMGIAGGWNRKTFETPSGVRDATFSPSAINILTAHADHTIRMWSSKTGDCLKTLEGHTNLVSSVSFSGNGREAVSGGDDRSVRTWDLNSGKNTATLKGHTESVSSVAFSRSGDAVLSGSWDRTIRLWRIPGGTLLKTMKGHVDHITSVAFIGDTGLIVSAGFQGSVKMWDLESGRQLRDLKGHQDSVTSLCVSPTADQFLTGSLDGTARLWDVKRGSSIQTFGESDKGIRAVSFSPDQRFISTGGDDAVVRIWSVETGQCCREFLGQAKEVSSLDFASNGRFLLSASGDGIAMLWELDWDWEFDDLDPGKTTQLFE